MYLYELIDDFRPEDAQVECKRRLNRENFKGWLKTVDGFANKSGGVFYLGVEDKNYELNGYDLGELDNEKLYFSQMLSNHFKTTIGTQMEAIPYEVRGKTRYILKIKIFESAYKPVFLYIDNDPLVYVRNDGKTSPATSENIYFMAKNYAYPSFDIQPTDIPFRKEDFTKLYDFYKKRNDNGELTEKLLGSIGFFDGEFHLKKGATLFSDKCADDNTLIHCNTFNSNTRGDNWVVDTQDFKGNLTDGFKFMYDYINKQMNHGFIKTEGIGDDTERTEQAGQPSETEKTDEKKARKASKTVFDKNKTYKFSVIMPFNANAGKEFANINFLDFYSGILLAVKDMKESGMKIRLEALDMGDYGNSIESIIESGKIDDSYFIIGPPDRNNLKKLATYCNGKKIAVVSPMDANAAFLAHENPFFVQMVPSNYSINRKIIENFAQAADTCTSHLIIYEKGYDNFPMLAEASEYLTKNGIAFETVQYGILEGREILPEIMSKMKISDSVSFSNKVLIASENQAFVSDAVRNMELAEIEGYDIELFGLAKWKGYENIDLNLYHKLELKLVVPYDIDYGNQRTDRFVKDYRALFKADPTPYSFQGYDIASYMLELLFKYDKDYLEELPYVEKTLLQSNVRFTKCHENCGYVNHAYKEIEYMPDYSVIEKTGKNRPYDGSENHAGNDKTITNPSGRDHGIMAD